MRGYRNSEDLVNEIQKRADLFIDEFIEIPESKKNLVVEGVDRSPSQMIAYQLGWMRLMLSWESRELSGEIVKTPHDDFKWNNLGGLYERFYSDYKDVALSELISEYRNTVADIIKFVKNISDEDLFLPGGRNWAASTPANWPVWKWVHINTVAPFQTFRSKIRKWKRNLI